MQITLSSKEFDEAVSLWLKAQGFTTDRYSISTRVIAGRSDGPLGTRLEVQLGPKPYQSMSETMVTSTLAKVAYIETMENSHSIPPKRFGQGHADE